MKEKIINNIKNHKIIYVIVAILFLLTIIISSTFAWFTFRSENTNISFSINGLDIDYTSGNTISGNLTPVYDKSDDNALLNTIVMKSNNSQLVKMNLLLDVITLPEELKEESFVWYLYKDDNPVNNGNFSRSKVGDTLTLTDKAIIDSNTSTYKLYIYIDANLNNPIDMMNKQFKFNLYAQSQLVNLNNKDTTTNSINLSNTINSSIDNYRIYGNSVQGNVPKEYQELDYIESTGTQYIDTGFIPSSNTNIEIKYAISTLPSGSDNHCLIGAWSLDGSSNAIYSIRYYSSKWFYYFGSGITEPATISPDTNVHTLKTNRNELYIDDNLVLTQTDSTFSDNTRSLTLFAQHTSGIGRYGQAKVYNLKIYDNDILVRNMFPCYRKSDNEIGMYDTVNNLFYENSGAGHFSKGNLIPSEANPMEIKFVGDKVTDTSDSNYGKYKIPVNVTNANNTLITNIYLDEPLRLSVDSSDYIDFETQTLHRQVGVQIVTGNESWQGFYLGTPNVLYRFMITSENIVKNVDNTKQYFTHFPSALCATTNTNKGASIYYSSGVGGTLFRFRPVDYETYGSSSSTFLAFIRKQYANGTPVTGYYPLLNETVENIDLPEILTLKGNSSITINTEVNPSKMEFTYYGQ